MGNCSDFQDASLKYYYLYFAFSEKIFAYLTVLDHTVFGLKRFSVLWLHFDCILATFCLYLGYIFACILASFWLHFAYILATFCLYFGNILTIF